MTIPHGAELGFGSYYNNPIGGTKVTTPAAPAAPASDTPWWETFGDTPTTTTTTSSSGSSGGGGGGGGGSPDSGVLRTMPDGSVVRIYDDNTVETVIPAPSQQADDPSVYITTEVRNGQEFTVGRDRITGAELWASPTGEVVGGGGGAPNIIHSGGQPYVWDPGRGEFVPAPGIPGDLGSAVRNQGFGAANTSGTASAINALAKLVGAGGAGGGRANFEQELALINARADAAIRQAQGSDASDIEKAIAIAQINAQVDRERSMLQAITQTVLGKPAFDLRAMQFEQGQLADRRAAAESLGGLISLADPAALPAILAAGGGNVQNAIASGEAVPSSNSMIPAAQLFHLLDQPLAQAPEYDPASIIQQIMAALGMAGGGGFGQLGGGMGAGTGQLPGGGTGAGAGAGAGAGTGAGVGTGTGAGGEAGAPGANVNAGSLQNVRAQHALAGATAPIGTYRDNGQLQQLAGVRLTNGMVLMPNGAMLEPHEYDALVQDVSGFSPEEKQIMGLFQTGMGGIDEFASSRAIANAEAQLRKMGYNIDLGQVQQLIGQGEEFPDILRAIQGGLDLSTFLPAPPSQPQPDQTPTSLQIPGAPSGVEYPSAGAVGRGADPTTPSYPFFPGITDPNADAEAVAAAYGVPLEVLLGAIETPSAPAPPPAPPAGGRVFGQPAGPITPLPTGAPPPPAPTGGPLKVRARGGPVPPGEPFIAGDAPRGSDEPNEELIIPLPDGSHEVIPLSQLAQLNRGTRDNLPRYATGTNVSPQEYLQQRRAYYASPEYQAQAAAAAQRRIAQQRTTTPTPAPQPTPAPAPQPAPSPAPASTPPAAQGPAPQPSEPAVPTLSNPVLQQPTTTQPPAASPAPAATTEPPAATPAPTATTTPQQGAGDFETQSNLPSIFQDPNIPIPDYLQPYIDQVGDIRQHVNIPDLQPYNVNFLRQSPTIIDLFLKGRQAKYGIPVQDQLFDINRFALPGARRSQLALGL